MFAWDPRKATIDFEKHRVSFEEAVTIFADPEGMEVPRWQRIDPHR